MAPLTDLEKQLQLEYFLNNGFHRLQCSSCRSWFWTLDSGAKVCGDQPCVEYSFIGQPLTKRPFKMADMREKFLTFFEERGHTRVARYPVVARWRTDIYLTIASIADFQPFVTSGEVPPPANPLCISQPCIRLNDLANVGKSGRHMTQFEMMAHHAFNRPGQEIYWADKTVEYCDTFLTKDLEIKRETITYKENPWAGGGNAGPAVEVLAGGLEVATLVFMNLKADAAGAVDVKGEKYSPLDLKIVDTGWGLERLTWASQGKPTVYDAAMPEMIEFLRKYTAQKIDLEDPRVRAIASEHARLAGVMSLDAESNLVELRRGVAKRLEAKGVKTSADELARVMGPVEDLYALADHAKCLSFMLGDGIVPSNVRAGYLCRLILRRSIRLMESLGLDMRLRELVLKELEILSPEFPELRQEELTIAEILDLEAERYKETIDKGTRLIQSKLKRGQSLGTKELIDLYDSQGLPPQIVRQVAEKVGVKVEIPDAFDMMVAERHSKEAPEVVVQRLPVEAPPTRALYYETPQEHEFDATILWSDEKHVVLDQTLFYPEGGGQPCDLGQLKVGEKLHKVTDVQKQNGVIIHSVEGGKMKVGELAHGRVEWERRSGHMRHHTATHIVRGAAEHVLGNHVWQSGAQKAQTYAHLDLTHFKRLTPQEVQKIESLANDVVMRNIHLERVFLERNVAERKFGVRLYQGGVPPGNVIRVVRIGDHDVESCAGTHVDETSDVGPIKIYKTERIQDGIERIEYAAGPAAVQIMQERDRILDEAAKSLSVPVEKLPATIDRFFTEWKQRGKEIEDLRLRLSHLQLKELLAAAETRGNVRIVVHEGSPDELQPLANALVQTPGVVAILGARQNGTARILVARSADVTSVACGDIVRKASAVMGGSGGGKPEMAQGGGTDPDKLADAIRLARSEVLRLVG
jgi:alanyl-tRNA synthetase